MCGRFTQAHEWAEIVELYRLTDRALPPLGRSFNIAPTQPAGVVVLAEEGPALTAMRFGLVPAWARDEAIGNRLVNARSESLRGKRAFRDALAKRRCVVPVSGFYEWQRLPRGKQPWYVCAADGKPLALAGLWESWNGLLTFTIITVPASEDLAPIHDRMPAVLDRENIGAWLADGDTALLRPAPPKVLAMWPVSVRVNSPANNDPLLIKPASTPLAPDRDQGAVAPDQLSLAF